jgi:hypothetical protein
MSFRFLQRVCLATVAATAMALLSPLLRADELPEGKPVKRSDPTDKEEATGARSTQGQNELLEKLQSATVNRKTSLDGLPAPAVVPPPPMSVVPDSKTQEMMDRRKDWIFSTPEQLILGRDQNYTTESENTRADDGTKQKLTPMEEYYLNLVRPPSKAGRADRDSKDDSRTPAGLRDKEDQLKQLILSESPGSASSLSGVRADGFDYFGGRNAPVTEQNLAQKARTEEYRQLIGLPSPQASMKELLFPTPKTAEATQLSSGLGKSAIGLPGSLKATEPSDIFVPQDQVGMIPSAPQLADVNARVLNPAILGAGSMKVDTKPPQPNLTPPTPTFSAPRRMF